MSKATGIITGKSGADAARYAARDARDQLNSSQGQATEQLSPWSTYGRQAMVPLSQLLYGKNFDATTGEFTGDVPESERFNAFQQSPGYQYQLDQGLKAIQRQNAATGTLLGGNTLKELQTYGNDLANQDYQSYINNLMGQANIGQQADTNIANSYLSTGSQLAGYHYAGGMAKAQQYNNMTNLLYGIAGSRAAGAKGKEGLDGGGGGNTGSGTYNGSFFQNAGASSMFSGGMAAAMSDINLKENIQKVGEEKGFNIYEFNYKGQPERYRGVMAQEVKEIIPEAVIEKDGFLAVDYSKIGIEFKKL